MKRLVRDIHSLRPLDRENIRLYDLYELLTSPAKVRFRFEDDVHEAEAAEEDGAIAVRFDDRWFRTVDDFFQRAELDGALLTARYEELRDFEVM